MLFCLLSCQRPQSWPNNDFALLFTQSKSNWALVGSSQTWDLQFGKTMHLYGSYLRGCGCCFSKTWQSACDNHWKEKWQYLPQLVLKTMYFIYLSRTKYQTIQILLQKKKRKIRKTTYIKACTALLKYKNLYQKTEVNNIVLCPDLKEATISVNLRFSGSWF